MGTFGKSVKTRVAAAAMAALGASLVLGGKRKFAGPRYPYVLTKSLKNWALLYNLSPSTRP